MRDVMIDLETLGTAADAVIMSIGAVKFDLDAGTIEPEGFYASVSIDSNLEVGRRVQEDTLLWWIDQNAKAQAVFKEEKMHLAAALDDFHAWFDPAYEDEYRVWSNGADFDIPMIAHAMKVQGLPLPWKFWNNRCFRTYKNLPHAARAPKVPNASKHNALADAYAQTQQLIAIHKVVMGDAPNAQKVKA